MRGRKRIWWLVLAVLMFGVSAVSAREILEGDACTVTADETIDGNLFVVCRTLVVSGVITGDLVGIAASAEISGTVNGDIYMAVGRMDLRGTVGGSLHFAGAALQVQPDTRFDDERADVYSLALSTRIDQSAVPGSVTAVGYQLVLDGDVGGDVSFWGSGLVIRSNVDGDVDATVGNPNSTGVTELATLLTPLDVSLQRPGLRLSEEGRVGGQLTYSGPTQAELEGALENPPLFNDISDQITIALDQPNFGLGNYLEQVSREFITIALFGVLAFLLVPRALQAPLTTMRWQPLPGLGVGLLAFILSFPVVFIALGISILLVLLVSLLRLNDLTLATALILGVLNFSVAGIFYFAAIYMSRILVCLAIGRVLTRRLWGDSNSFRAWIVGLLVGVLLLAILSSLPTVGLLFNALAAFLGLGSFITYVLRQLERARDSAVPMGIPPLPADLPPSSSKTIALPPPIADDAATHPGEDNLPEGFHWWQ